jgi:hypothetical protein
MLRIGSGSSIVGPRKRGSSFAYKLWVIESSCFCRTQHSWLVYTHRFIRGRKKAQFQKYFFKGTAKQVLKSGFNFVMCVCCLSLCSPGTTLLGPDRFCWILYWQFVLKFVDIYHFLLRGKFPTLYVNIYIPFCLAGYELRTGNRKARKDGETLNDLNITTEYYKLFHTKNKLMFAFTSVLNMALRFGEKLRSVFFKACEVTFKVVALSIFLQLLTNLKSGSITESARPLFYALWTFWVCVNRRWRIE